MKRISFFTPLIAILLSSCALMQRHEDSGYHIIETSVVRDNIHKERQLYRQKQAMKELGIQKSINDSEALQQKVADRLRLKKLEQQLRGQEETNQYYKYKPYFRSDRERIHFLSLSNIEQRSQYLTRSKVVELKGNYSETEKVLIEENDLGLGMTKKAVRESWGPPDEVEVAGDPRFGNERWRYKKAIVNSDAYKEEMRLIYFEAGRVVGWQTY